MGGKSSNELFELHAEFCKAIASATRLRILELLGEGEQAVGKLAEATRSSLANISQHLRLLRNHDIVRTRKEGRTVYYRLRDPRLVAACQLTRSILLGAMEERGILGRCLQASPQPLSRRKLKPEPGTFSPEPRQFLSRNGSKQESKARTLKAADSVCGFTRPKPRQERKIGHDR
jgi:DNA-binding transcriptional ArsR family regulator